MKSSARWFLFHPLIYYIWLLNHTLQTLTCYVLAILQIALYIHWGICLCLNMNADFYWKTCLCSPSIQPRLASYDYVKINSSRYFGKVSDEEIDNRVHISKSWLEFIKKDLTKYIELAVHLWTDCRFLYCCSHLIFPCLQKLDGVTKTFKDDPALQFPKLHFQIKVSNNKWLNKWIKNEVNSIPQKKQLNYHLHAFNNEWMNGNYQTVFQFILSKPTTWNAIKIDNLQQTSNEVNIRVIRKCKILGSM